MRRRIVGAALVAMLLAAHVSAAQSSATEESLKLAHQLLLSGISTGNPAVVEPLLSRDGIGFFRDAQAIAQLGGAYGVHEALPSVLADLARFSMATYDVVYRVTGTTGVVCMAGRMTPRKGEKGTARYLRSTWVYAYVDGLWRLVSWHSSDVPVKK